MCAAYSVSAPAHGVHFAQFDVSEQVFQQGATCAALVNLKPVVPGHVLVIPTHAYKRLADIPPPELGPLFEMVQRVGVVVERVYGGEALSVAVQDGAGAGQSVPHVHVHVLPRRTGDFTPNDLVYEHLDAFGLALRTLQEKQMDSDRQPRTASQLRAEAEWLRSHFTC